MYEDVPIQSADKPRCSQRLTVAKSYTCLCCNSVPQTKTCGPQKADAGNCCKESPVLNVDLSAGNKSDHPFMDMPQEKQVSVGPDFQAEVPKWTGEVSDSDSKWLGERMWPPEAPEDDKVTDLDAIGRGEPIKCNCLFPKTTECIRFHIAEKRLRLSRELGPLFYKWRFNRMGEEVSLSWTRKEEVKFENMIRLYSGSINKFWNLASKIFPSKTREMLVSYYFNVYLIRRRSYQNRVTPKDIDSDDDEKEIGSVGDRFGYRSIYVPKSKLPICSENKQHADLEEHMIS